MQISANKKSANKKRELFFLRVAKYTGEHHQKDCLFYNSDSSDLNKLVDEDGFYSSNIFKEPIVSENKSEKDEELFAIRENHRNFTFNNFCTDLIINSNLFAYNLENKITMKKSYALEELYKYLQMPSFEKFYNLFYSKIKKFEENKLDRLIKNEAIEDTIKNNNQKIHYGIVGENIFSDEYVKNNLKDFDKVKIQFLFFLAKTKSISTKNLYVPIKKLQYAGNLVKINNNYIKAPYFVIAITDKYNSAVRFYVQAINYTSFKNKYAFVDSNKERVLAQEYIEGNKYFVKPIKGITEYTGLNSQLINLIFEKRNADDAKRIHGFDFKNERPDFILFENKNNKNFINIVELSGFTDEVYLFNLKQKIKKYQYYIEDQQVNAFVTVVKR